MRWLLILLLLTVAPAQAQSVRVSTGEHGTFTRLVLGVPSGTEWKLGRTPQGYALALGQSAPQYDLARAFDRIDRRRIADLRSEGGRLLLDIGCACHAIPFQFRPDMLVIDVRDGPPPPGSSFELGLSGAPLVPLTGTARPSPAVNPDQVSRLPDWAGTWLRSRTGDPVIQDPVRPDTPSIDAALFRDTLLMELGRAAADGLIDPVDRLPEGLASTPRSPQQGGNLRIGDGLTARPVTRDAVAMTADGATCPPPDTLAIEGWADDRPAAVQFAAATQSLVGEFDAPNPDAIHRAVRLNLHLGFGAEAGLLLAAYPTGDPDAPLLLAMSRIVDGLPDPSGPFPALAACDGPAALWAALSAPVPLPPALNRPAALRAFSTLPAHLRKSLGPTLAETFLAADDVVSATTVVEAILRLPGEPDDRTQILAARLSLIVGGGAEAQIRLEEILADPGPEQSSALIALVDLHAQDGRKLDPRVVTALAAYREESVGTSAEASLLRAELLATALAGDFTSALAGATGRRDVARDLWRLLAAAADDQLVLAAIGADPTDADPASRTRIAERLAALGFVAEGQRWSGSSAPLVLPMPPSDPLRDALVARDWQALPADAPAPWATAAAALRSEPSGDLPPLAGARQLAEESARTRTAIGALLDDVPPP